ncbi:MAG: cytochrome c biogenesis protein CcdA [Gammaproteobacteria bacterium]
MEHELLNIGLAFLEGFALIISPCILPILPIILSGSLEGGKKRPMGIILGFVLIFATFTFFSRKLVQLSGINLDIVRNISFALLLLLGIIMVSTYLTEKFGRLTQRLTNVGSSLSSVNNPQGGFLSGVLFGCLVAFIWTPCAGPILAAVIVQTVVQQTNLGSFLLVLAFGIGAAVPMLIIALLGRQILTKFAFFRNKSTLIRKILGVIIILSVLYTMISTNTLAIISTAQTALTTESATVSTDLNQAATKHFKSSEAILNDKMGKYSYPISLPENTWALNGSWIFSSDKIMSASANASFKIHFNGRTITAIMGNQSKQPIKVKLLLNGEVVVSAKGQDVSNSIFSVSSKKSYRLIELKYPEEGILEIIATAPGLEMYSFNFTNN